MASLEIQTTERDEDDKELLARLFSASAAGNVVEAKAVFSRLYELHSATLTALVRNLLGWQGVTDRDGVAFDICQAVWLKAWASVTQKLFVPAEKNGFYCWLRRVATNRVNDYFRKQGKGRHRTSQLDESHVQSTEVSEECVQRKQALNSAMAELEKEHPAWAKVVRAVLDGIPREKIAVEEDISRNSVDKKYHLAKKYLTKRINLQFYS